MLKTLIFLLTSDYPQCTRGQTPPCTLRVLFVNAWFTIYKISVKLTPQIILTKFFR